jgi:hypothetical protein
VYTYVNGDSYTGEYKNDRKNGMGSYKFANGDQYMGQVWKCMYVVMLSFKWLCYKFFHN